MHHEIDDAGSGVSTRRRTVLGALASATVAGLAGCQQSLRSGDEASVPTRADARIEGSWPMHHADAGNARAIDARADDTCYLYVEESMDADARAFVDAFDRPGLLVLMPVVYRTDGTVGVTAVGSAESVQDAVEAIPAAMGVTVETVGEFVASRLEAGLGLTQRQLEAVRVAVDCGYYREPREATLEDLAQRLDSSTGTVGELLRRAERTVMGSLVDGQPL